MIEALAKIFEDGFESQQKYIPDLELLQDLNATTGLVKEYLKQLPVPLFPHENASTLLSVEQPNLAAYRVLLSS